MFVCKGEVMKDRGAVVGIYIYSGSLGEGIGIWIRRLRERAV